MWKRMQRFFMVLAVEFPIRGILYFEKDLLYGSARPGASNFRKRIAFRRLFEYIVDRFKIEPEYNAGRMRHMEFVERKRWLFLGLPFTFTKYTIREDMITIDAGLLKTVENDCYMYKVQDVQLTATLAEKLVGLGTVTCFTGDTTDPTLRLVHIKNSRAVKDFILEMSEKARLKRRTVNMLDIGSGDMDDTDDAQ